MAVVVSVSFLVVFFCAQAGALRMNAKPDKPVEPIPEGMEPESPLILVPGLAGSRLAAEVHKESKAGLFCKKDRGKHLLWPPVAGALPMFFDCWQDNIKLHYDEETGEVHDTPGVKVTVPGFGRTEKVERLLDLHLISAVEYMETMINTADRHWHYTKARSIRTAPYDFRKVSPKFEIEYHRKFKHLIEETYQNNDNKAVTVVCHSLGCLVTLRFFQMQDAEWKKTYVKQYVVVGAPYGGATSAVHAIVSGVKFFPHFDPIKMREIERSWPSFHLLMPTPKAGISDYPLLITPSRTYTTGQLEELYHDVAPNLWNLYEASTSYYDPLSGPGVETYCLAGANVETPKALVYDSQKHRFPDGQPAHWIYGDGDGTVLTESISLCKRWKDSQKEPVYFQSFNNATHVGLLKDHRVLEYLFTVLFPGRANTDFDFASNKIGDGLGDFVPGVNKPGEDITYLMDK